MKIIVYIKTGCPWCLDVTELLQEKKVEFEERNVTENKDFFEEMMRKSSQTKAPTLDIDGEILADSDAKQVAAYLKEKGVAGF